MTLVPIDPSNEASVVTLLERAAQWLSEAVHRGEPGDIAMVKAQMATAAEATKQLGLSKDIQLDAQEMVRRAEYALGKAIRRGQAEGTITSHHSPRQGQGRAHPVASISPKDYATKGELLGGGSDKPGIYAIADEVPTEVFEEAINAAKDEGDLSRVNIVRKIKGQPSAGVVTRDMRADLIATLAEQGYSSRQMPEKVGVSESTVRQIARDFEIEIPADRSVARTRRVDSNRIAANTVTALEGLVMGIDLINYDELDAREASQWADSLSHSIRALNRFVKQIKESAQ